MWSVSTIACTQHTDELSRPPTLLSRAMARALRRPSGSALYVRTSTKTNRNRGGASRGQHAAAAVARAHRDTVGCMVREIINGGVPTEKRKALTTLMEKMSGWGNSPKRIYRESARDLMVGEAIYNLSVALGVQLVPSDAPDLFTHTRTERKVDAPSAIGHNRARKGPNF